jgi:hypothetical protein
MGQQCHFSIAELLAAATEVSVDTQLYPPLNSGEENPKIVSVFDGQLHDNRIMTISCKLSGDVFSAILYPDLKTGWFDCNCGWQLELLFAHRIPFSVS